MYIFTGYNKKVIVIKHINYLTFDELTFYICIIAIQRWQNKS